MPYPYTKLFINELFPGIEEHLPEPPLHSTSPESIHPSKRDRSPASEDVSQLKKSRRRSTRKSEEIASLQSKVVELQAQLQHTEKKAEILTSIVKQLVRERNVRSECETTREEFLPDEIATKPGSWIDGMKMFPGVTISEKKEPRAELLDVVTL